jgi:hypothetical protein
MVKYFSWNYLGIFSLKSTEGQGKTQSSLYNRGKRGKRGKNRALCPSRRAFHTLRGSLFLLNWLVA